MGTKIWCPGGRISTYKNVQIPYPLISLVTQLPQSLNGYYPLTIHCRDFKTFTLSFKDYADSSNVFDSVKGLTVASTLRDYCIHVLPSLRTFQLPYSSFMHSTTRQARLSKTRMVGLHIPPLMNLPGWVLVLVQRRGDLRT